MKRVISVFVAVVLLCAFTACGQSSPSQSGNGAQSPPESEDQVAEQNFETVSYTDINPGTENRVLVVSFSRWGNTDYPDDVDATTSASILIDGDTRYGTTEYVAKMIAEEVGGDLYRIETINAYTADFDELRDINHDEMARNYLPELKESDLDISQYDTVFIGYPVWAMDVPQAVISFLTRYDLSGKIIAPFCTHDGYGAGSSYGTIGEASHAEKILDGLAIEASEVPTSKDTVTNWLRSIGVAQKQNDTASNGETPIKIAIGDIELDGVIYDTPLAREIKEQFPLTISMVGYGGREYYGGVDFYPENLEGGRKTFEDGDITYCDPHHNMAIFYAQTDDPILSVEVIPIGKVTSDLAVFETLDSRETITFSLAE